MLDENAAKITDVVCEWAPRPTKDFLDDRTALDAIVFYETESGESRFCGVETKYTEPFSTTEYWETPYEQVTRDSGWFTDPEAATEKLQGRASNQLWRNLLLAAALEKSGRHGTGWVAVVALADDPGVKAAAGVIEPMLSDASRLRCVSIESMLDAADEIPTLQSWSTKFRSRYVGPIPS